MRQGGKMETKFSVLENKILRRQINGIVKEQKKQIHTYKILWSIIILETLFIIFTKAV